MQQHADARGLARSTDLRTLALVAVGVLVAAYLLLVLTPLGQSWDDAALVGRLRATAADRREVGQFLKGIDAATILLLLIVVLVVGFVRRRARLAFTAGGAWLAAVVSAEVLKALLPRPSYGGELAILASKEYDTYPSGHSTIATGFVLALVMVANNRWRPLVALLGVLWAASVTTGVVAAGWHRPSDAIGGIALATAWLSFASSRLAKGRGLATEPGRLAGRLPVVAIVLASLGVLGALVAALTGRQDLLPADVPWWAFPLGQMAIDVAVVAAVGRFAWLLRDIRFGDPQDVADPGAALPGEDLATAAGREPEVDRPPA
ncbi:MAG: phosphatase PAP2 family protein [Candidatus Nanopelagicales bacterium]